MIRSTPLVLLSALFVRANDPIPSVIPAGFVDREQAPAPKEMATPAGASVTLDWTNPASIRTNVPNDFTLTVRNQSTQIAHAVVVQVRLPAGVTATSVEPQAKNEQGVLLWEFGTLAGRQSRTIRFQLTTATKRDITCQAWVTATGASNAVVAVREPQLAVQLEAPRVIVLGDRFDVKTTFSNIGNDTAILNRFDLNGPLKLLTDPQSRISEPKLLPGQKWVGKSEWQATEPGSKTITTVVGAEGGIQATDSITVNVLVPKLTVAIVGPTLRQVGRKATYTVTVTNSGEVPLKDVRVRELFPAEFRLDSSSLTYTKTGSEATWQVGELLAGQSKVFTYDAVAICPGPSTHQVKAIGSRDTAAMAAMKTVVEGIPALRMEMVDSIDPIERGGVTTYEVKLTNTGTKADHQVVLECQLPAELAYVSANGPTMHRIEGSIIRFDPIATLAPKTETVYRITVKACASGDLRFKATATTAGLTKPVTKDESTRVYGE